MNGYEFLASLVSSFAWPALIAITLLVGRKKVSKFADAILARVPNMSEFNAWSVGAKFAERSRELRDETQIVESLPESTQVETTETTLDVVSEGLNTNGHGPNLQSPRSRFSDDLATAERLLEVDPRAAAISAWIEVERAIQVRYEAVLHKNPPRRSAMMLLKELTGADHGLNFGLINTIRDLSSLRNSLVHEPNSHVSAESAEDYLYTANSVIENLRGLPVRME